MYLAEKSNKVGVLCVYIFSFFKAKWPIEEQTSD